MPTNHINNQKFICLEGGEACGKSTQIDLLATCLKKHQLNYIKLREPGSTKIGEEIRSLVLGSNNISNLANILLYTAARHENLLVNIIPNLNNNFLVLIDRYLLSTLVYQGNNNPELTNKINLLHKEINFNLLPHITFILSLQPEIAIARITGRTANNYLDNQPLEFHKNIHNLYNKHKIFYTGLTIEINANQDILAIHSQIITYINKYLNTNLLPLSDLSMPLNSKGN